MPNIKNTVGQFWVAGTVHPGTEFSAFDARTVRNNPDTAIADAKLLLENHRRATVYRIDIGEGEVYVEWMGESPL